MTATLPARRPATNGHAPRRPGRIEQALVVEAITANGASLQVVLRLPAGPWRSEMQVAHIATHTALVALLSELRMAAGRWDGLPTT